VHYCTFNSIKIFYYQLSGKEKPLLLPPPDKENPGPEQAGISCFDDDFAIDFADYLSRFVSQLYF